MLTSVPPETRETSAPAAFLNAKAAWRWPEYLFWLSAFALILLLPNRHLLMNEIAILGLFALSLDLILGYAGIVSLGHAAFFGVGAYAAGLLTKYGVTEPVTGLLISGALAGAAGFLASFMILRGTDLTRLMVTLGVALIFHEIANRLDWITGGTDGLLGVAPSAILGRFEFDFTGRTAYVYSLSVTFLLFLAARRIVNSPFGLSLKALKDNRLRAATIGIAPNRRLIAIYTLAAVYAGMAGALLTQTTQFVSLEVLDFSRSADALLVLVIGGSGYLYGGLIGAIAFKLMKDTLSAMTPAYWIFWMGFILVILVLIGRDRLVAGIARPFAPLLRLIGGRRP
ncbi:branched-chain amino acid ABC transporter permease [Bosea sp. BK604]|uniref:branched-chain amino acid ABC transporter permease n=1 Tax=Bosea sp. BK604 TaxID=2512180 RepID=UPI0010432DFB|nr:branched-chain amino acid ABC transporter permease [Bosea sp. BK604]TCR66210.1 amino acid/amide ABC transporter membrane protein 2 (HAAT family) [Bosea sp. BK604]